MVRPDKHRVEQSFNGTIFHVWKGNHPCRIYVTDRQVYFIRRAAVHDGDPTPPDQLLSKHASNYALALPDIVDPRIEPEGKFMSFGKNNGRWHFTRRGDSKETVVLFESPAGASHAISVLGGVLGNRLRGQTGSAPRTVQVSDTELVTDLPLPPEQAELMTAMHGLTRLLSERAPAEWQKLHCEVRGAASDFNPKPLDITIADADRPDQRIEADPAIDEAAMRLARKFSPSVKTFPGLVIEMARLDQGRWHTNVKLMGKR